MNLVWMGWGAFRMPLTRKPTRIRMHKRKTIRVRIRNPIQIRTLKGEARRTARNRCLQTRSTRPRPWICRCRRLRLQGVVAVVVGVCHYHL